ncbi:MAG: type II toxin-antitoxin system VapC family toxin [Verrucomicrobiota bacterium]
MATLDLPAGSRVYLDANIFIYAVERIPPYDSLLRPLFTRFDRDELDPVTSQLTLAEVLVKPIQVNSVADKEAYLSLLATDGPLEVVPVDRDILIAAATLRAQRKILLADAIHVATAVEYDCNYFLTNDQRLKLLPDVQVLLLSDYTP